MNTDKTSLDAQRQPSCLGAVSGCRILHLTLSKMPYLNRSRNEQ